MNWKRPFLLLVLMAIVVPCVSIMMHAEGTAGTNPAAAETQRVDNSTPLKVDRLDPSVDRIIPADAMLERVATGFTWLEGPVWVKDSLYFADIPGNSIHKWNPVAGVSTFLKPSGYQGAAAYGGPEPGSNGMTLDARGRLTVAGHAQRDVYRLESLDRGAPITILAVTDLSRTDHVTHLNRSYDLFYSAAR